MISPSLPDIALKDPMLDAAADFFIQMLMKEQEGGKPPPTGRRGLLPLAIADCNQPE